MESPMKQLIEPPTAYWKDIRRQSEVSYATTRAQVETILDQVRRDGDDALARLTKEFDGITVTELAIPQKLMDEADNQVSQELRAAIAQAMAHITTFHRAQASPPMRVEVTPGVWCWTEWRPIERVGLYIPGGSAPLVSTLLMLGVPAKIAGCADVVLCTPPYQGSTPHPAILYVAKLLGIQRVFCVGGAQAIAAMAYGTRTIPAVDKIFGPGNQFVTLAKQAVCAGGTAIDMPAGPSELLVIADDSANPEWIAADLLSQAEHGPDSQVILLATSAAITKAVLEAIERQLPDLPRSEIARQALAKSYYAVCRDVEQAIYYSNDYAPEHLMLCVANPRRIIAHINNAGSIFLGPYSPEVAGDYASGTNHVLPTGGAARAWSGLGLDSFMKRITFQELSRTGFENMSASIVALARAEGLEAHARAVTARLIPEDIENILGSAGETKQCRQQKRGEPQ